VIILRLKQAECALADGRLDEAAQILNDANIRSYRRGQELAGLLSRALIDRGRQHLAAGRLVEADGDCRKASLLAGNLVDAAQLGAAIRNAMQTVQHKQQEKAAALATARQQIQQGQFSLGQKVLKGIESRSPEAQLMLNDLANRRAAVEAIATRTEQALARDDWEAAIELLVSAGPAVGEMRLRELSQQTAAKVHERIEDALAEGRLDLAQSLLNRLGRIAQGDVRTEQQRRILEQCRKAWQSVTAGQLASALEVLRRLETSLSSAKWVRAAIADLESADDAIARLRGGAIATIDGLASAANLTGAASVANVRAANQDNPRPPVAAAVNCAADKDAPSRFVLQADGVGAFLVIRQPRLTLGPVSASRNCDVALLADASTPVISIDRIDEDYVLTTAVGVLVNDQPTSRKLLVEGDRIALSPRCRFVFRRPSPASTSALLDLNGTRIGRADVRRVILMDRELIIGPGPSAHIRCDELPQSMVLCVRDGQLVCQARTEVYIDEQAAGKLAAVGVGSHIRVGDLRLVITSA